MTKTILFTAAVAIVAVGILAAVSRSWTCDPIICGMGPTLQQLSTHR